MPLSCKGCLTASPLPLLFGGEKIAPGRSGRASFDPLCPLSAEVGAWPFVVTGVLGRVGISRIRIGEILLDQIRHHVVGCTRGVHGVCSPESGGGGRLLVRRHSPPLAHTDHTIRTQDSEVVNPLCEQSVSNTVPKGMDGIAQTG